MTFDDPQSRNEAILQNILGADNQLLPPFSRIEVLLIQLLEQTGMTEEEIAKKLAAPLNGSGEVDEGAAGQILQTNGDGTTSWVNGNYGAPLVANTAAEMTDHTRVYVYTGSETGYTSGHWYYWDDTEWADGGVYNAVAVQTDTTLTEPGVPADAKATGDALNKKEFATFLVNSSQSMFARQTMTNNNGSISFNNSTTRILTNPMIPVGAIGKTIRITPSTGYKYILYQITSDNKYVHPYSNYTWISETKEIQIEDNAAYVVLSISNTANTEILLTEYDKVSCASVGLGEEVDEIHATVNTLVANVSDIEESIDCMNDLQYVQEKTYLDDLEYGRIEPTGSITSATYIAYSPQMRTSGDTWYFDSANFRLYFAYYANQEDTTPVSMSAWITSSPFTVPTSRPYYKIMVARLTNAGTLDIASAQANTYQKQNVPSALIDAGVLAESRLKTAYVSATTGADTNGGTADAPYATIQKALDAGAANIFVEEGTYPPISCSNKNYPIKIALWGNDGANKKIKITSNGEGTANGVNANNCLSVTLSDVWVDNVPRHLFCAVNTKEITFIRCIASNNSVAAFMGFYLENTNAFLYDCVAHDIAQDGFNFHGYGNSYMQNCVAYDCTDDGVSHHDKCTGSIVGGEFYGCGKGGVASPTYGANINIYNVYSHDNNYGLFAEGLSDRSADIKARVSGCVFLNNANADIRALYGEVIAWSNIYNTLWPNNNAYTELHSS